MFWHIKLLLLLFGMASPIATMNLKCLMRHGPTYCSVMNQTYNDENEPIIFDTLDIKISDYDFDTFDGSNAGNNFSVFPNAIFKKFPYLTVVTIGNSELKTLNKKSFSNCLALEILFLGPNLIEHLDAGIFEECENLLTIDLSKNKISSIDKDAFRNLGLLESLYLYENSITTIHPETFNYLPNVLDLHLNHNQIAKLHDDTFKKMTSMWSLVLSYNKFATIQSALFKDVPRLIAIKLGYNRINAIEPDFFEYWPSNITIYASLDLIKNFCIKKEFTKIGREKVKSIVSEFAQCFKNYKKINDTLTV